MIHDISSKKGSKDVYKWRSWWSEWGPEAGACNVWTDQLSDCDCESDCGCCICSPQIKVKTLLSDPLGKQENHMCKRIQKPGQVGLFSVILMIDHVKQTQKRQKMCFHCRPCLPTSMFNVFYLFCVYHILFAHKHHHKSLLNSLNAYNILCSWCGIVSGQAGGGQNWPMGGCWLQPL